MCDTQRAPQVKRGTQRWTAESAELTPKKSSGLMSSGALAGITGMPNLYGESAGIRTQDPRLKSSLSSISIAA